MSSETNSTTDENEVQAQDESKQERIKQRLKDMGVSEDSERPKSSWLSRYGRYAFIVIVGLLVAAYWIEYTKSDMEKESQVASSNAAADEATANNATANPSQPANVTFPQNDSMANNEWIKQQQARLMEQQEKYQKAMREQFDEQKKAQDRLRELQAKHQEELNKIYQSNNRAHPQWQHNGNFAGPYPQPNWRGYPANRSNFMPGYMGPGRPSFGNNNNPQAGTVPQQTQPEVYPKNQMTQSNLNQNPQWGYQPPYGYPPMYGANPYYYNGWPRY